MEKEGQAGKLLLRCIARMADLEGQILETLEGIPDHMVASLRPPRS
jgi:hypothetical protein